MDPSVRNRRRATANQRIALATDALAERFGIHAQRDALDAAGTARYERDLYTSEAVADLLEAIVAATAEQAEPASEFAAMGVDPSIAEKLIDAGYGDAAAVRAASDDDLLAIKGVGKATVRDLRASLGVAIDPATGEATVDPFASESTGVDYPDDEPDADYEPSGDPLADEGTDLGSDDDLDDPDEPGAT